VRILAITGAGVSAKSGIPTFRARTVTAERRCRKTGTREAFERIRNLFGNGTASDGSASATRSRMRARGDHETSPHADEFLLVTQNVDDLHCACRTTDGEELQIHGDIFVTRCSQCDFRRRDSKHDHEQQQEDVVPRVPECDTLMRARVVLVRGTAAWSEVQRVEEYLDRVACDLVIVAGTTATFGYIIDWALRAAAVAVNLSK